MIWVTLICNLCNLVVSIWLWVWLLMRVAIWMGKEPAQILLTIRGELRPFIPVLALVNLLGNLMVMQNIASKLIALILCAITLIIYVMSKDEDDRWKRRRKKLADKVKSLGHKLVVAPTQG